MLSREVVAKQIIKFVALVKPGQKLFKRFEDSEDHTLDPTSGQTCPTGNVWVVPSLW